MAVNLEEENKILKECLINLLLKQGLVIKQSYVHELKDHARKAGLNPENFIEVLEPLLKDFLSRVFKKKEGN